MARALLDAFVLDRLTSAVWPSVGAVAALLVVHAAAGAVPGWEEAERVLVGAVVLAALCWSVYGLTVGARAAWPHLRFWAATRLSPRAHLRLVLFHVLRAQHRRLLAADGTGGLAGTVIEAGFEAVQRELKMTPDRAAYTIADHLAPIVLRHLASRLALVVLPIAVALVYYRFALYPELVRTGGGAGPWGMALYPVAALVDLCLGTGLRATLSGMP